MYTCRTINSLRISVWLAVLCLINQRSLWKWIDTKLHEMCHISLLREKVTKYIRGVTLCDICFLAGCHPRNLYQTTCIMPLYWGAGLAQWWEGLPSNNVSQVRFLDPASYIVCGLSLLVLYSAPRGFSPGTPVFPCPQKPTFNLIWFDLFGLFIWFNLSGLQSPQLVCECYND